MSIYQSLIDLGYIHDEITANTSRFSNTRTFTVVSGEDAGGNILVGVSYSSDFRSEEERGPWEIRKTLFGPDGFNTKPITDLRAHVGRFSDVPGGSLVVSLETIENPSDLRWGHNIMGAQRLWRDHENRLELGSKDYEVKDLYHSQYDKYWESALAYAQDLSSKNIYSRYIKLSELQEKAKAIGVEKPGRTKAAVMEQIAAADVAQRPNVWPGWFHNGDVMVLRADRGLVSDVLRLLYDAALAQSLVLGGSSLGFGTGVTFYDIRDISKAEEHQRAKTKKWHETETQKLKKVQEKLKEKGHQWYSLDNIRQNEKGETLVWLNSTRAYGPGGSRQAYGWFTFEELLAEKFVQDFAEAQK